MTFNDDTGRYVADYITELLLPLFVLLFSRFVQQHRDGRRLSQSMGVRRSNVGSGRGVFMNKNWTSRSVDWH